MGESTPPCLTPFDSSNVEKDDFPKKHEIFAAHNDQQSSEYIKHLCYVAVM